ncbi:Uncharacterised protein [Streptococcus pneumoniae]|nr:Uncharacterised protein [Streptococcus pneumoniae]
MTITINFTEKNSYITDYLNKHGINTTTMDFDDFMALMEDIEDARAADQAYDQAYMEYLADPNPKTYTTDELLESLGMTREDIA